MSKTNGGPAFPIFHDPRNNHPQGMTKRDVFALHADLTNMQLDNEAAETLLGREAPDNIFGKLQFGCELVAKVRFMLADAMLVERNKE